MQGNPSEEDSSGHVPHGGCAAMATPPRDSGVSERREDLVNIRRDQASLRRGAGSQRRHVLSKRVAGWRLTPHPEGGGLRLESQSPRVMRTRSHVQTAPRPPLLDTVRA